jgi:hypothetical protein
MDYYIWQIKNNITIYLLLFIYGVGDIPIIAIVCAAAYQEPAAIAAPCEDANNPPATGPAADNPAKPKMKGEPIVTPNTTIGAQITADKNPILIYILFI